MIVLGVVLLLIGWLTGVSLIWIIGAVLAVVGCVLALAGGAGHSVGTRRHYY